MDTKADFQLNRFWNNRRPETTIRPLLCLQGGGLKGGWQGGVLDALMKNKVIRPLAAYGTSAGAINSVLISVKAMSPDEDIFGDFWSSICFSNFAKFLRCEFRTILYRAPKTLLGGLGWGKGKRAPGLLAFEAFQKVFEKFIPKNICAKINTYIEITDVSYGSLSPSKIPFIGPSFWLHEGDNEFEVCFGRGDSKVSIYKAVAASCCIPVLVNPPYIAGRHVADGGLCTNLPVDQLPRHGSLGGDSIVFILARPLSKLNPDKCDIDYRTLAMLHKIKEIQQRELTRNKREASGIYNILIGVPIFVIQPETLPRMDNPFMLLWSENMGHDIEQGRRQGDIFFQAVKKALNGEISNLSEFHLFNVKLPPLPKKRPKLRWWYSFANRSWVGTRPGDR